jgi:hypothetical protein
MKKAWIAVIAPPVLVLFIWLMGELVMHLWNWLLPPMFGWHLITFWQALGLLVLSRIFFGSWGPGGGRRSRGRARWDKMTPEERDRLRKNWGARCGGLSPASDESTASA